jgi:hypothetical protein
MYEGQHFTKDFTLRERHSATNRDVAIGGELDRSSARREHVGLGEWQRTHVGTIDPQDGARDVRLGAESREMLHALGAGVLHDDALGNDPFVIRCG